MNVQITAPKEFEESSAIIGVPKVRNLLPSKKYRENVKKWGESTEVKRRRVIVVPSIKCAARDVTLANEGQEGALLDGSEADGFDAQVKSYRKRLEERKRIRGVLNTCGLKQDWLRNKDDRTKLENRVLKRLLQKQRPEIAIKEPPSPPSPVIVEEDTFITGEDRGVPTIHHPSPAALAIIQDYLDRKRLRLIDLFAQADKDKNWVVSRLEFRNIIRSRRIPLTEVDLEDLILALDRDNSDALDYRELAVGRQSYLEQRPETIPEEQEQGMEPSKEKITTTGTQISKPSQISAVPQRPPTAPRSPSQRRPSSSPQRPYSPKGGKPVSFMGQRPDSEPQSRESRPFSPAGSSECSMSPTLLEIPAFQLSDKVEQLTKDEIKDRRSKKQQKRKEKEKKQRKKAAPDRTTVAPSTLGGRVGEMVDRYRKMTLKEYNDVVELCQMHGVQVSKALLGRVLLQPEDKPLSQIKLNPRKAGLFAITTRHHITPSKHQSLAAATSPRRPKFKDLGPST
ncbi:EF-hand calcium-binding domain-containing protein 12 [Acropora cervicornis]|uniref:EF-hand calcium-binding domain-containing protein 12 n=1 Tax=Acropora cervicornis TaxID=6130 RepID=A0AAD9UT19_ACRCE|nr:EF-hand calcium-binding domain-containing protein 12 [Acropora cervicornis]